MNRLGLNSAVAITFLLFAHIGEGQTTKIRRIGWLTSTPRESIPSPFVQGLRERGWFEGENIVIERRFAKDKSTVPQLASELVQMGVDVIVAGDSYVIRPAKRATSKIPIVMTAHGDPISAGHIASFARPGGNITGQSIRTAALAGKRLEVLREVVPNLSRVAVLGPLGHPEWNELKTVSQPFGIQLQALIFEQPDTFETLFQAARKKRSQGLVVVASGHINPYYSLEIVELATQNKLPAIYPTENYVDHGGLMAYGMDMAAIFRRAAHYVDKILKGAEPSELPVEQATKVEFIVNLGAAKQIGLTIPPEVLYRADKVIK
jgi:putative ABC transport system substrate-binding protein